MAQFDVYRNTNTSSNEYIPYLLDVQSDLLDILNTRVVVPLEHCSTVNIIDRLNPVFSIENTSVFMSSPELSGVSKKDLGKVVASLATERNCIIAALDMLFTGF